MLDSRDRRVAGRAEGFGRRTAARGPWSGGGGRRADVPLVVVTAAWASIAMANAPLEAPNLPPLVRSKQLGFTIPFQLPEARERDGDAAPTRVLLQVSRDLGGTWENAGEVSPQAGVVTYRAPADGEYWFRLRTVDRQGRTRGGPGPDMRVLVDVAGPRLTARVWKGADGEIVCRYAAADDSIDLKSLRFEYRTPGDPGWKTVAAEGILARQAPAHMVGEEIWWAGEKVDTLGVRITVADDAGNQTVRQFSLEPSDPHVEQAAMAVEIGVPPLPGATDSAEAVAAIGPAPSVPGVPAAIPAGAGTGAGWPAERAAAWAGGQPAVRGTTSATTDRDAPRSVLVASTRENRGSSPTAAAPAATAAPTAASIAAAPPDQPLEYRGRPLLLSRSRRFAWEYEMPRLPSEDGTVSPVLWSTSDGGATWDRVSTTAIGPGALEVTLPGPGLYGFRLELVADAGGTAPRAGDAPETWVGIDEEPPQVELIGTERIEGEDQGVVIRYGSHDTLLAPRSTRLLFSPHADGPWATITSQAENQGAFTWRPDRGVPARVYLRVEVADAAGNVGSTTSAEPIAVAPSRFTGRLGDLKPLPATPTP